MLREDQLKRLAEALEHMSYDGSDSVYRDNKKAVYSDIPVLEYGDFGGNCRQLGVYSYRGFDVVVTSVHGDTPVEGKEFTVGIYEMGGCDALDGCVGKSFSFRNLLDHNIAITDFTVMLNGVVKPKTILLM